MGNQPGVTRMEPSDIVTHQDSSASRRRSSEARKERQEMTAQMETQENFVTARDILSDVVNVCLSRAEPDMEDSKMNRTFTKDFDDGLIASPGKDDPKTAQAATVTTEFDDEGLIASPGKDVSKTTQAATVTTDFEDGLTASPGKGDLKTTQAATVNTSLEQGSSLDKPAVDEEGPDAPSSESSPNHKGMCEGDRVAAPKPGPFLSDVSATKSELDLSSNTAKDSEIGLFFDAATAPVKAVSYSESLEVNRPLTTDGGQRLSNTSHEPFPEASRQSCGVSVVLQRDSDQGCSNDSVQLMDFGNATLSSPLASTQFGDSHAAFLQSTPELYDKNVNFLPSAPAAQPEEELAVPPVSPTLAPDNNSVVQSSTAPDVAFRGTLAPVLEELSQQEIVEVPEKEHPPQQQQQPPQPPQHVLNCVPTSPAGRTELPPAAGEPLDTEAGPEVAQFSEEEFRRAAEYLKDPSDFEFLQKVGCSRRLRRTSLGRCSLFLKFDPLVSETPASTTPCKEELKPSRRLTEVADGSDQLIDFSSSPLKGQKAPSAGLSTNNQESMFSEKEMSQALKYQELMFQERLLKKDKDYVQQLDSVREEADKCRADSDKWRARCEELNQMMLVQQTTIEHIMSENSNVLGAMETFLKDRKKCGAEKDASLEKALKERDQLSEDLHNVEIAFADFHRRYEKAKHAISIMKENEAILKKQLAESYEKVEQNYQMFIMLKTKTEESLEGANKEMEDTKRSFEADITVLKGQLKKAEMNNNCLEKRLEQKTEENAQLAKLYDDLLGQVKAK